MSGEKKNELIEVDLSFSKENLLQHIRNTFSSNYTHSINRLKDDNPDEKGDLLVNLNWFLPKPEFKDRYTKIDAHAIFAIGFYYSSKQALKNKDHVLSSIGQYYALFHLSFSLVSLNFANDENILNKVRHSQLKNLLRDLVNKKVITEDFVKFFEDLQEVREYLNYINVPNGYMKFMTLKRGHSFTSRLIDRDIYISSYCIESVGVLGDLVDKYFDFLHEIENSLISKSKTKGNRPELFKCLRRVTLYDWYGEDFLNNFFNKEIRIEIERFLGMKDVSPDANFFDDY